MPSNVDLKSLALRGEQTSSELPAPPRRFVSRYVLPGCLVAGFLGLIAWSMREAFLPRRVVSVVPVHVTQAEFRTAGTPLFKAAGWVEPRPTPIRVAALIPGVVEELLVVEDQAVDVGEPVARLVDDDAKLALEDAQATLRLREAELKSAEATLQAAKTNLEIPAHLELPVAEAEAALAAIETELSNLPRELARARARLKFAKVDYATKKDIRETIAQLSVDLAESEVDAAEAHVEELIERKPVLEEQRKALLRRRDAAAKRLELKTDEIQAVGEAEALLLACRARLRTAQVAVDTAELQLSRTVIPAPCSGRVLQLVATPGAQVGMDSASGAGREGSDMSTVVTLYRPSELQVRVDVRFEDLPQVVVGQPVLIESPALSQPLQGEVLFLTGFANIQKNTLEVKVSLQKAPEFIKPEMLVDVTFLAPERETTEETGVAQHRMFVPRSVVQTGEGGAYVWLADRSAGVARRQRVDQGPVQTPTMVEIASGLNISSRVIVEGREGLEDGTRIDVRDGANAFALEAPEENKQTTSHLNQHPR